ncbi:hypothetical protein VTP01DRAFT_459 [Rhizomucor pusillus]|uniref:uncharacterized protein n=1 Tax=Rhizomucor pusillus TaxID=4840 RepID=UPI003742F280
MQLKLVHSLKQCNNHAGGPLILERDVIGAINMRRILKIYMHTGDLGSRPLSMKKAIKLSIAIRWAGKFISTTLLVRLAFFIPDIFDP